MSYLIRPYKQEDFEMILGWWGHANEVPPTKDMLTEDSTFICEYEGVPALCLTAYLTNCKAIAYIENFVGNPKITGGIRKELSCILASYMEQFLKQQGYKNAVAFCYKDSLIKVYEGLGMSKTVSNLTSFVRRI